MLNARYLLFVSVLGTLYSKMDPHKLKWECLTILEMLSLTILNAFLWTVEFQKKSISINDMYI